MAEQGAAFSLHEAGNQSAQVLNLRGPVLLLAVDQRHVSGLAETRLARAALRFARSALSAPRL
jgi:hypothetical protein